MSRGWESKSVESQMEEAALRRAAPKQTPPTAEEIGSRPSAKAWNYRASASRPI
jgi:hypothetical protein